MNPVRRLVLVPLAASLLLAASPDRGWSQEAEKRHAIAMHGDVKYPPDFAHFDYVDPDAPKGGSLAQSSVGSFDSLNPFLIKGEAAAGISILFESLSTSSADEPFTEYGLLAESVETPEDRGWVAFTLRPEARWQDGEPVTVDDVIWSLDTLKSKASPFYRAYYADVVSAEAAGERRVLFRFKEKTVNRELPLIVGQMPILPKHWYEAHGFEKADLTPPVGSGPYKVSKVNPGRSIVFDRVKDYWGADIPVNKGRYNFDTLRYEYYRDENVALEAFKAGEYDLRVENTARLWATGYTGPAVRNGLIKKEEIRTEGAEGMQGFAFNLRRPFFQNPKVREALAYAFDFEWTNKTLFNGAYTRSNSYFSNSELASSGLPEGKELALLEPFKDELPPEVFTQTYAPPITDGSGRPRDNLKHALELLREAGYEIQGKNLVDKATGQPLRFEILLVSPAFERITAPFLQNLQRLGVQATMRTVDTSQYINRLTSFDYDMIVASWGQSLSPGNEQREFWGCDAAKNQGSRNLTGVCDPAIEALIGKVINADSREDLVTATHALDRVLLWQHLVIPHWYIPVTRVAYWGKFDRPKDPPRYGIDLFSWWVNQGDEKALQAAGEAAGAQAKPE